MRQPRCRARIFRSIQDDGSPIYACSAGHLLFGADTTRSACPQPIGDFLPCGHCKRKPSQEPSIVADADKPPRVTIKEIRHGPAWRVLPLVWPDDSLNWLVDLRLEMMRARAALMEVEA